MTTIVEAQIHEHSITLWLRDKEGHNMAMTIPCATRGERADIEDRLLSSGVKVIHA